MINKLKIMKIYKMNMIGQTIKHIIEIMIITMKIFKITQMTIKTLMKKNKCMVIKHKV
jgi:hypothetical protein